MREHHRDVGVALVRLLAGQALVEDAAEGVDVGGRRDLLRLDLLGRRVVDGADEDARLRQLAAALPLCFAIPKSIR